MSEAKTAKAAVELTKNEEGTWLTVDIGGRKATVSLNNTSRGPMITGILTEWAESHFLPTPVGTAAKRAMTLLLECLIAGTVTILLLGAIAGALWLVYAHAGAMPPIWCWPTHCGAPGNARYAPGAHPSPAGCRHH